MLENRRSEIDSIVSFLCTNYDTSSLDSLKKVAKDNGIRVIETRRTVVEFICTCTDGTYIFTGPSPFPRFKRYGLAHELGHKLIDQTNMARPFREIEAEYFARSLVGKISDAQVFATIFVRMVINPLGCLKYKLDSYGYEDGLVRMALGNKI